MRALLLIAGIMSFQAGNRVSRRLMGWDGVGPAQRRMLADALHQQIDALGAPASHGTRRKRRGAQ